MHELSVTQSMLELALRQVNGGQRITDLYLVIGQLSSMIDDSVQFYWNIISENTAAAGATLHFNRVPAAMACQACGQQYPLGGADFTCPNCGSAEVYLISGDEFYLEAIEIETEQAEQELI